MARIGDHGFGFAMIHGLYQDVAILTRAMEVVIWHNRLKAAPTIHCPSLLAGISGYTNVNVKFETKG